MKNFDLVVVSHLRWNFVWQRPQQLLTRLAEHHRILFIEEPMPLGSGDTAATPVLEEVARNVVTLVPRLPAETLQKTPAWLWPDQEEIGRQILEGLRALDFRDVALWFYTPMPEFVRDVIQPDMIVYDVMDELSNFKFAPADLPDREHRLLSEAAVVFTGGASMFDGKRHINPNTHLFASGVDAAHYESACLAETEVPGWLQRLPSPRATYIGVIDERLDYDLLRYAAAARPGVQFVMCGPVTKVDESVLPRAANIHYAGQQQYADLPRILKGSDICMMPFAINDATKFISPTKTLEYMATHRPIISTPITDVVRFYSDIVHIGGDPDSFVATIDAALHETAEERARKHQREEKILVEQAWSAISDNMEMLMQREWAKVRAATVAAPVRHSRPANQRLPFVGRSADTRVALGGE